MQEIKKKTCSPIIFSMIELSKNENNISQIKFYLPVKHNELPNKISTNEMFR